MNTKPLKTYGKRTDKSMRTIVRIEKFRSKFHNKLIDYLDGFDLTFNQFKVLEVLYHRGDLNIGSITKLTTSTPGNITVVVRNLKRDGWIKAISDPEDRRASILTINEKGIEVIEKLFPDHAKNVHKLLEVLSDDELDTLYELINKVYKAN
jgi:MarR family 2-MHQ and catechol resistance regulon transcriptional repressor